MHDEIQRCLDSGLLLPFEPRDSVEVVRPLYVTPDLNREILSPIDDEDAEDMEGLAMIFEAFMFGNPVTATLQREPDTDFKRLQESSRLVWEVRVTDPRHLRVFGCFAAKDHFVAIHRQNRGGLNFDEQIRETKLKWASLIPDEKPFVAGAVNAYIS